jgi:hypothetical protein
LLANPYDLDGDGDVDGSDVLVLDAALGAVPGQRVWNALGAAPEQPVWNALADLNADGRITMDDRLILVDNLDEGVVPPPAPTEVSGPPTPTPTQPAPEGDRIYLPYGSKR